MASKKRKAPAKKSGPKRVSPQKRAAAARARKLKGRTKGRRVYSRSTRRYFEGTRRWNFQGLHGALFDAALKNLMSFVNAHNRKGELVSIRLLVSGEEYIAVRGGGRGGNQRITSTFWTPAFHVQNGAAVKSEITSFLAADPSRRLLGVDVFYG